MMNDQDTYAGGGAGSGKAAAHDRAFKELRQPTPQEFDIRIAADGSWYHEGGLIGRPALVKLFSTALRREADGSYWLVTPVERGRIEVEDAPFIITALAVSGAGEAQQLTFRTNVDDEVHLGPGNPLAMRMPPQGGEDLRPYIMVRDGLEALVARPVFYELAEMSETGPDGLLGFWSGRAFFALEGEDR